MSARTGTLDPHTSDRGRYNEVICVCDMRSNLIFHPILVFFRTVGCGLPWFQGGRYRRRQDHHQRGTNCKQGRRRSAGCREPSAFSNHARLLHYRGSYAVGTSTHHLHSCERSHCSLRAQKQKYFTTTCNSDETLQA